MKLKQQAMVLIWSVFCLAAAGAILWFPDISDWWVPVVGFAWFVTLVAAFG